jgi:DNA-binding SARP family transcriptional activator
LITFAISASLRFGTTIVRLAPWRYLGVTLAGTRVQLCGQFVVRLDGRRIEGELPGRQGRLLLAFLALNRVRSAGRDELIEALWPEGPPASPHAGLSALLSKLRRLLGPSVLTGLEAIRLQPPTPCVVDVEAARELVHQAESLLVRGDLDRAYMPAVSASYIAERRFLPGLEAPWIEDERRELDAVLVRSLECVAEWGPRFGGTGILTGERAARRLIDRVPYRETGYRFLMEALAARDNRAEALEVYERCRRVLRDELGTVPCPTLQDLHQRLLLASV